MHPIYKGENLTAEQAEIVRNWANIKLKHSQRHTSADETLNSYIWWKEIAKCDYFANEGSIGNLFNNLILQLLTCSVSSASNERIFSIFSLTHSNVRNH